MDPQASKNGILIDQLPPKYKTDALDHFLNLRYNQVKHDKAGLRIYFKHYSSVQASLIKKSILVRGIAYSIYPLVTNLTLHDIGPYASRYAIRTYASSFGPIIDVYEVEEDFNPNGRRRSITNDYRIILNVPEVLANFNLFPLIMLDRKFKVSFFCRLCRRNGHKQHQCSKIQAKCGENVTKSASRHISYNASKGIEASDPPQWQNADHDVDRTRISKVTKTLPGDLKLKGNKDLKPERDLNSTGMELIKGSQKNAKYKYHPKTSTNSFHKDSTHSKSKHFQRESSSSHSHPRPVEETPSLSLKDSGSKNAPQSCGEDESYGFAHHVSKATETTGTTTRAPELTHSKAPKTNGTKTYVCSERRAQVPSPLPYYAADPRPEDKRARTAMLQNSPRSPDDHQSSHQHQNHVLQQECPTEERQEPQSTAQHRRNRPPQPTDSPRWSTLTTTSVRSSDGPVPTSMQEQALRSPPNDRTQPDRPIETKDPPHLPIEKTNFADSFYRSGSNNVSTKKYDSTEPNLSDGITERKRKQSRKRSGPELSRILPPSMEAGDIRRIINDANSFGSQNLPLHIEEKLKNVIEWNQGNTLPNLSEQECKLLKLIQILLHKAKTAKIQKSSSECCSGDLGIGQETDAGSRLGDKKDQSTSLTDNKRRASKIRCRRTGISSGIIEAISRVNGKLMPPVLFNFLLQVRGRKNLSEIVKHFTPDNAALVAQLEEVVGVYYRYGMKGKREDSDIRWIKDLCSRLAPCSVKTESSKHQFSNQHAPGSPKIPRQRTSLSPGIREAISKVSGTLEPTVLLNFLVQIKGRKNISEIVHYFTTDSGALVGQLKEVLGAYYRSGRKSVDEEQDARWIRGVCQRLLQGQGTSTSFHQQPLDGFTNGQPLIPDAVIKTEPTLCDMFKHNPAISDVLTEFKYAVPPVLKTEPIDE